MRPWLRPSLGAAVLFCALATAFGTASASACERLTFLAASDDRPMLGYWLASFPPAPSVRLPVENGEFALLCVHLPEALASELAPYSGRMMSASDLFQIRGIWQRWYGRSRTLRGDADLIPESLAAFATASNYRAWPVRIIATSAIKGLPRRIFRSPAGYSPTMSVAETLNADGGGVRETEIAVERRGGRGDYDFYVYGGDGARADESEFPSGLRAAPLICAACHYDRAAGVIGRLGRGGAAVRIATPIGGR